jgi:hypothetical protein
LKVIAGNSESLLGFPSISRRPNFSLRIILKRIVQNDTVDDLFVD